MKFLFDECVSPRLVGEANELGYEATCLRDRDQLRMSDSEVARLAEDEDFIIVTNNAGDFRGLLRKRQMHPGLVVLPQVPRARQLELFRMATAHIVRRAGEEDVAPRDFMFSRVVEIDQGEALSDAPLP